VEPTPRVIVVGKPGCHLCVDALPIVERVCADLGVAWGEWSIFDEARLFDEYWDKIPVVLVDGAVHSIWRVDEAALRRALAAVA
jgi:hypothetical protein